jgi:hypothetical protein
MALLLLVAWLALPTLIAGWWLLRSNDAAEGTHAQAQWKVVGVVFLLTIATAFFRLARGGGLIARGTGLEQTAALFIGVPALLAMAAVFIPARSAKGVACKSVTVGLLISLIFLGEGMLCVLMSAPLFYLVAVAVGAMLDSGRRRHSERNVMPWLALLSLMPMSMEGVSPITTIARDTVVSETRIVHAAADAVAAALLDRPRFDRPLPTLLARGFPRPLSTDVEGRFIRIAMRGGEMRLNGMEPRTGTLVLERVDSRPGFVRWRAAGDDSHMRHFLTWQSSDVTWQAVDAATTRVTWSIRYRRDLDPAWYFGPMERYAVRLAAGYLIDSVATP